MTSYFRLILIISAAFFLTSCKQVECGKYYKYVDDMKSRQEILSWADSNIFSLHNPPPLGSGRLVGPGRRAIKGLDAAPGDLAGDEVRLLGLDAHGISGVFIGRHSFRGILIAREENSQYLEAAGVDGSLLEKTSERVAVMCYQEKENMSEKN